ncbi:MAG: 2-hydroxychromene-2-carboxylate isomerase [Methyloceanibacter sp.]
MAALEFWYEFGSTYSYPAAMRIERLAQEAGISVRYRPFLLGPILKDQGLNDSPFNIFAAKGRYMWRDLARVCDAEGLALKLPPVAFPQNGLKAARLALVGEGEGWMMPFTRAVFAANFAEQKDIGDEGALGAILAKLGVDAEAALGEANTPPIKDRLKQQTGEAARRGIFGAPSFTIGEELFWGNDRLEAALAWATRDP